MDRRWHRAARVRGAADAVRARRCSCTLGIWQLDRARRRKVCSPHSPMPARRRRSTLDAARRAGRPQRYPLVSVRGHYDAGAHVRARRSDARRQGRQRRVRDLRARRRQHADPRRSRLHRARRARRAAAIPPPPAGEQQLLGALCAAPGSGLRIGGNALPRQTSVAEAIDLSRRRRNRRRHRPRARCENTAARARARAAASCANGGRTSFRPNAIAATHSPGSRCAAVVVDRFRRHALAQRPIDMTPDNRNRLGLDPDRVAVRGADR